MPDKTVILPIRLDSFAGDNSALEAHFYEDKEEYGGKSVPDDSMWIAVWIVNGKIDHSLTEYGYHSLEEILKTHKKEKIIGLRENQKDAELEEARDIAEDTLGVLLSEENVLLHVECELNLPDGAIKRAYRALLKARKQSQKKPSKIDKDEIFYSLCVEDIFWQAKEMKIPKKKLTPEVIKRIKDSAEEYFSDTVNDGIRLAISDELGTGGADQ